jgi:hypothetical protein
MLIIPSHGPHRKHSSSIVEFVSLAAGTYLPSRCQKRLWYIRLSRDRCITTALHAATCLFSKMIFIGRAGLTAGVHFESRQVQLLFWLKISVIFLIPSRRISDITSVRPRSLTSDPFQFITDLSSSHPQLLRAPQFKKQHRS